MKYKNLFLAVFAAFSIIPSAKAQFKNFNSQLKAILAASWDELRGHLIQEEEDNYFFYKSNKNLDGFKVRLEYDSEEEYGFFIAEIDETIGNSQLFESIHIELLKLKKDGYIVKDEKQNSAQTTKADLKHLHINKDGNEENNRRVCIALKNDNRILLVIEYDFLFD